MQLSEYPLALRVLSIVRNTAVYVVVLGYAVACLVAGTTLARGIGAVLLAICLVVGFRIMRRHFANPS
jgi:hypothetical protein